MAEPGSVGASRIEELFARAMREHQHGRFAEAEALYHEILQLDPRQLDGLHFLGVLAHQRGDSEAAVRLIGRAIEGNDGIADYHASMAEVLRALGRTDEAVAHDGKAVEIEPKYWQAHAHLADALRAERKLAEAETHYRYALAIRPDFAPGLHNLAATLLTQGHANEALDVVTRALAVKETEPAKALFVQCARIATALPGSGEFRALLLRALSEPWGRPVELARAAIAVIAAEPTVAKVGMRAEQSWPRRLTAAELGPCMGTLANDPLLRCLLETTPVCDIGLEHLLTSVRALLLEAATSPAATEITDAMLVFSCALARQCFINDYVFAITDDEQINATRLRATVDQALRTNTPVSALRVIAAAAYGPLHTLEYTQALAMRPMPAAVGDLIRQQVAEPLEEQRYRTGMRKLTPIQDGVSQQVQRQYEDNPYPSWVKAAPARPAAGIAAYLRAELPEAPLRDVTDEGRFDMLIAGCGTGQQPIEAAQRFPNARVLAIDLSRASLAYAQRKTKAAGLANIDYAQADILKLGGLGRKFNVIEASGVLHHLADPLSGWRVLTELLRPDGFIRIGLYSELARSDIVAARAWIAERGYKPTAHDIRRCRQEMLTLEAGMPVRDATASPDFFSTSACRDLLFHVQEQRVTLPAVAAFLAEQNLTFLGFELDAPALTQFRMRFPQEGSIVDLDLWHRFETENPGTFGAMYQFWVQKGS
jgi:2-polyprenyl-3-methyl-5-hydroxy-6-metoxy-1,4-benzoquinol methylase/Tfp pilus assembly protein PilF